MEAAKNALAMSVGTQGRIPRKKLAAFKKLTNEITELNTTDPLPPEFDKIVSQRLHFREISGL